MITRILSRGVWSGSSGWVGHDLWVENGIIVDAPKPDTAPFQTLDLSTQYLYPAFRDGHCHPLFAGREAAGIDISDCVTIEAICAEVSRAAEAENAEWLEGGAYDRSLVENGAFRAEWIDSVCPDRPVVLHASDHHTIWVNTKAMELAGVLDRDSLDVEGGSIDVDAKGRPTGVFREWPAMNLILSKIPPRTLTAELEALEWAQRQLLAAGIVQVQDAWIDRGMAEIYLAAAGRNQLHIGTNLGFRFTPDSWREDLPYFLECKTKIDSLNNPLLTSDCAKFFLDGILGSGTAAVLEPYLGQSPSDADPHQRSMGQSSTGDLVWNREELFEAAKHASEAGLQLHFHAIGDAAVRLALDIFEALKTAGMSLLRNPVVAHAELVAETDVPRFAELGVIANFQPLWARQDGMLTSCVPGLGWDRVNRMYPMKSFEEANAKLAFGSDWPVSSCEPLKGIATATTRMTPEGSPEGGWVPEQRLSLQTAWRAYSEGVARQLGNLKAGNLLPGQSADLVALPVNCFEVAQLSLNDLKIEHLMLSGQLIF